MEVVNKFKESYDVYGGRHRKDGELKHMNNTEPGDRGWLGNPYSLDDYDREESIELFRKDFEEKWNSNEEFRSEVKKLRGKKVGCFCKPKDCHLDVIKEKITNQN